MPNRDVHLPISATAGALTAGICANDEPVKVILFRSIGGFIGGSLGGLMPDLIDPPKNGPNHRSFGHGIIPVMMICSFGYKKLLKFRDYLKQKSVQSRSAGEHSSSILIETLIGAIDGFVAGYFAHLVMDSGTPKGLPLLK